VTERTDLDELRAQLPDWHIGTVWATAATGPDARRITARRDGVLLSAWTAAELAIGIQREEASR
jgi:hypothetical protein